MAKFRIHPAIGFARLGNSDESHPGPTVPWADQAPATYRDNTPAKRLKKQEARFWVYLHDEAAPGVEPVRVDVGPDKAVRKIEWTVHVANRKAAWYEFDGLTGSNGVLGPEPFGYPADSLRNPTGSRDDWTIDPGPVSADMPGDTRAFSKTPPNGFWPTFAVGAGNSSGIDTLGKMTVMADSGLSVVGGSGNSGSVTGSPIHHYANNPGWFDDTSDGSVKALLTLADGSKVEAEGAWVVVGPPDFAPPIGNVVTLYDAMYDVAVRKRDFDVNLFNAGAFVNTFTPSFEEHIYPILRRAALYRWVYDEGAPDPSAYHGSLDRIAQLGTPPTAAGDPNKPRRQAIFNRLRSPANANASTIEDHKMPKLYGDLGEGASALTLTETQFFLLSQWKDGKFTRGGGPLPPVPATNVTASGLDRAALEACVGGAFFPGIECGWIVREAALYVTPFAFRFKHAVSESDHTGVWPGDVTKRSALPWQADFIDCADNWWPAQRPNQVRRSATDPSFVQWAAGLDSHIDMVMNWHELGVVVKAPNDDVYFESERNLVR